MRLLPITLLFAIFLCACTDRAVDSPLSRIEAMADTSPREALDSLYNIDYQQLSDADRHYYDFLMIKVPDKAYVDHTSDSLYLLVLDYESKHKGNGRYPEALYYGGRVYSDLGDYPTALKYFQDALDALPKGASLNLRRRILSQTGRLLLSLRLYDDAISHLKQVVHLDSIDKDTFALAYDNQLIGSSFLRSNRPDTAKVYYSRALHWAKHMSPADSANIMVYLAASSLALHHTDSALTIIRDLPDKVDPVYRNICLAYACRIYSYAGLIDSVYACAMDLAHSLDENNRKKGYEHLLSPTLISMTPVDSLVNYVRTYRNSLEKEYNEHSAQQAIIQNSLYNYQVHERERLKSEEKASRMTFWFFIGVVIILILIITTLVYRIRAKQNIIKLHESIAKINSLQEVLDANGENINQHSDYSIQLDANHLRGQLKLMLERMDAEKKNISIPQNILRSEAYGKLQQMISTNSRIFNSDPLWSELESHIIDICPNFKEKLHSLMGVNIKPHEMHTILLIKYGVTPTQMTYLLGISKGGVSSRRESLCKKILGEKVNIKSIDNIIRSL